VAALIQSSAGVALSRLLRWSIAPLAAENAEDKPRFSITVLPRSWHCLTNVPSSQPRSAITSVADLPLILALVKSGNCVFEWLPQMVMHVTASFGTLAFLARAATARL